MVEGLVGTLVADFSPCRLVRNQRNQRPKRFVNRLGVRKELSNIRLQHDRALLKGEVLRGDRAVCFVNSHRVTAAVVSIILAPDSLLSREVVLASHLISLVFASLRFLHRLSAPMRLPSWR